MLIQNQKTTKIMKVLTPEEVLSKRAKINEASKKSKLKARALSKNMSIDEYMNRPKISEKTELTAEQKENRRLKINEASRDAKFRTRAKAKGMKVHEYEKYISNKRAEVISVKADRIAKMQKKNNLLAKKS